MAKTATKGDWKKQIYEKIALERSVTQIGDKKKDSQDSTVDFFMHPRFEVYRLLLDKTNKKQPIFLSGSQASVALQLSLVKAINDLLDYKLNNADFEDWFIEWRKGFSSAINRPDGVNKNNKVSTSFPIKDTERIDGKEVEGWRTKRKPTYLDWFNPADKKPGQFKYWRTIEYFPDEDNPDESYVLSGSAAHLIQVVQYIEWLREGETETFASGISEAKYLKTWPTLYFEFREKYTPEGENKLRTKLKISLVNYVEDEFFKRFAHEKVLSRPFVKELGTKIETLFFSDEKPYKLKRGKEIWTYQDWKSGYALWCPLLNKSTALDIYSKICEVKGDKLNPDFLNKSEAENPNKFKPQKYKHKLLDTEKETPHQRRQGELDFYKSYLFLPKSKEKITLVSRSSRDPVSQDFFN